MSGALTARRRHDHLRKARIGGDLRHPAIVAFENTLQLQMFIACFRRIGRCVLCHCARLLTNIYANYNTFALKKTSNFFVENTNVKNEKSFFALRFSQ